MCNPVPAPVVTSFSVSVETLQNILANSHGTYRGTGEAVLGEVQGLRITVSENPDANPAFHLNSLRDTADALESHIQNFQQRTASFKQVHPNAYKHVVRGCEPLLSYATEMAGTLNRVEEAAMELRKLGHHNRLEGMSRIVVTGPRTLQSLVSSQLDKQGVPLIPSGVSAEFNFVMACIRQLPMNPNQAVAKVSAIMVKVSKAMRAPAGQPALQAAFGGSLDCLMSAVGVD